MPKKLVVAWLLLALHAVAAPRPFARVQLLNGGGLQTALFLGFTDGLAEHGWKPDLTIATCGGAIASMLIHSNLSPAQRLEFLASSEFHQQMRQLEVNSEKAASPSFRGYFLQTAWQAMRKPYYLPLPAVFEKSDALFWVPLHFSIAPAALPFPSQAPSSIVIGSRLLFTPAEVGTSPADPARRYYREVYFTDERTARWLADRPSDTAREFPDSALDPHTEVRTGWTQGDAARASIADLRYIQPLSVEGVTFSGGYVNLIPLELALELGEQVVAIRPNGFSYIESIANRTTIGFDGNARVTAVRKLGDSLPDRVRWIDTSDMDAVYDQYGLNPHLSLGWTSSMENRIPTSYPEYQRRVKALYEYGHRQAAAVRW